MPIKAAVWDYNGTLTSVTEEEANKHIGYGLLDIAKESKNYGLIAKLAAVK